MESSFADLAVSSTEEVPEVAICEPLIINKRGRSYLKNVPIDADNPALLIGWNDDHVEEFVDTIKKCLPRFPSPPPYVEISDELTALTFKDNIHMALSELGGGGYFSNIIAPCSLDQVMEMVFKLGDIQRHPFMQAAAAQAKVGPLAICGTCLDNKSCDVIPLKLFVPPPPTLQLFA